MRRRAGVLSLLVVLGCGGDDPPVEPGASARPVVHLIDFAADVVDYAGELAGVAPVGVVEVPLAVGDVRDDGLVAAALPWSPRVPDQLRLRPEGRRVDSLAELASAPDGWTFVSARHRSRPSDWVADGGQTTRDAVHETATQLLGEGHSFTYEFDGLGEPVQLRAWVGGHAKLESRCRLWQGERLVRESVVDGGHWRELSWDLDDDRGQLRFEVQAEGASDPAAFRVRVQWMEVVRPHPDRVVLHGSRAAGTRIRYLARPPRVLEQVQRGEDGRAFVWAVGGALEVRSAVDATIEAGGTALRVGPGQTGAVAASPGLLELRLSEGLDAVEVHQRAAAYLEYVENPDLRLRDLQRSPVPGELPDFVWSRAPAGAERRAGFFLPAPSRLDLDGVAWRAGDRLRGAVALADPLGEATSLPRGPAQLIMSSISEDGAARVLTTVELAAEARGWQDFEVELGLDADDVLRIETRVAAGAAGSPVLLGDPRVVPAGGVARERPDLLIYLVDTLRADDLGCYGRELDTSPRLDAFAERCDRFERFRAVASWTRPTVASMVTGLYPSHHGITDDGAALPEEVVTLAERLRIAGYSNAASVANVQVAALGVHFEQGFHRFIPPEALGIDDPKLQLEPSSRQIARPVPDWFARRAGEPSFLYLHSMDPHLPYLPPSEYRGLFSEDYVGPVSDRALVLLGELWNLQGGGRLGPRDYQYLREVYDEEIRCQDDELGRLLDDLEARGALDETIVLVLSDHGEEFHEHGKFTHAGRMWEELLHVPLLLWIPPSWRERQGLGAPRVVQEPVSQVDLLPSLLELLDLPAADSVHGASFVDLLRGATRPARSYSFETSRLGALTDRSLKLLWEPQRMAYLHPTERLSTNAGVGLEVVHRLYDLGADPGEQRDLAVARPEELARLRRLRAELEAAQDSGIAPLRAEARYGADVVAQLQALGYLGGTSPAEVQVRSPQEPSGVSARYHYQHENAGWLERGPWTLRWRILLEAERRKPSLAGLADERVYWLSRTEEGTDGTNYCIVNPSAPVREQRTRSELTELMSLKRSLEEAWVEAGRVPEPGSTHRFDTGLLIQD